MNDHKPRCPNKHRGFRCAGHEGHEGPCITFIHSLPHYFPEEGKDEFWPTGLDNKRGVDV